MRNGTATVREVEFRDVGSNIHITAEPDTSGQLLDSRGESITSSRGTGWMVRADTKASEKIELSKGTIWMFSTFPALGVAILMLIFTYGSSMMGWTRDDQAVRSDVLSIKEDLQELKNQITAMQKSMMEDQLQRAKIEGFKAGVAESASDHKGEK